ncbi:MULTISPECIES: TIGR03013 family XrtA/PEP-CTERM system glycosyltransferase [Marichromatium]|uniref:Sugar transferase (PEP-CTERM system associated)/exopolysaccharide biosynthesis polyprenyl glycosylphosphotransferase n=1 Tax=Marichromatium gracile TaxID=1048 RepID=A0A4R4A9C8_MARGR|nr:MULTISPECIES: TIGR03013 family XrtA/PEP-CTERM system glycosyltransferase [Marichromatium]MBK1708000.1 sugar transferase [Marichromatium gracile]RNE93488.1 TIGR03013 family PEP-CTERM/XrtA system glycosyltransferase [Marichromatium sp. AB32]TCW35126.1 sugar transferase (PEP-CTERM system associated)/exopolysaccharide biosynthesis polyprenyl glycosylphosphotransferase [Marichromatium gracile]
MRSVRIFRHYMRLPLLILAGVEGLMFVACFHASFHLRWWSIGAEVPASTSGVMAYSVVLAVVFVLSMGAMGLYEASLREGWWGSLLRIVLALLLGAVALAAISFSFPHIELWRSILALTVVLSIIVVSGLRLLSYVIKPGIFKRRVLVLGAGPLAEAVMVANPRGLDIVGLVPLQADVDERDLPKRIPYDRPLLRIVTETQADELVVAVKDRRGKLPIEELLDCRMAGIQVLEPQGFFEREMGVVKLDLLTPSWLMLSDGFQHGAMTMLLKRLFDVLVSVVFLVLLWPVMLVTALAIAAESRFRHPVFYRQTRIGENGMPFDVVKFRSMRVDAEADGRARWATKNDSRITRVGRFIRKTRIDELPQIFNVLKGEMSFVGPRPERPEFVATLASKYDYYAARHRVKPGLTGWAQLCYPYGSSEEDALRKLEYDLYYVKNYSIFLDLLILIETVEVVVFGKGAV